MFKKDKVNIIGCPNTVHHFGTNERYITHHTYGGSSRATLLALSASQKLFLPGIPLLCACFVVVFVFVFFFLGRCWQQTRGASNLRTLGYGMGNGKCMRHGTENPCISALEAPTSPVISSFTIPSACNAACS